MLDNTIDNVRISQWELQGNTFRGARLLGSGVGSGSGSGWNYYGQHTSKGLRVCCKNSDYRCHRYQGVMIVPRKSGVPDVRIRFMTIA